MYLYETHVHTAPVSRCATASVADTVRFYKEIGYAGLFITNHFLDGNIRIDRSLPYDERIRFYFSDYEEALRVRRAIGIDVFCGVEMSDRGTDFLVYGLNKEWFLWHPEIEGMKKSELLPLLSAEGALIVQAHPFREASYIDHIRLFPRHVHAVETYNACRSSFENAMADQYAQSYDLLPFAGSDNHAGPSLRRLGGMQAVTPVKDEADFVRRVKCGEIIPFRRDLDEE